MMTVSGKVRVTMLAAIVFLFGLTGAVQAGDKVSRGQALAIMEAMKMEHAMKAPVDGVVGEIFYKIGDLVEGGATLLDFEASDYH